MLSPLLPKCLYNDIVKFVQLYCWHFHVEFIFMPYRYTFVFKETDCGDAVKHFEIGGLQDSKCNSNSCCWVVEHIQACFNKAAKMLITLTQILWYPNIEPIYLRQNISIATFVHHDGSLAMTNRHPVPRIQKHATTFALSCQSLADEVTNQCRIWSCITFAIWRWRKSKHNVMSVVPEEGIKGKDKWLHPTVYVACNYCPRPWYS